MYILTHLFHSLLMLQPQSQVQMEQLRNENRILKKGIAVQVRTCKTLHGVTVS